MVSEQEERNTSDNLSRLTVLTLQMKINTLGTESDEKLSGSVVVSVASQLSNVCLQRTAEGQLMNALFHLIISFD